MTCELKFQNCRNNFEKLQTFYNPVTGYLHWKCCFTESFQVVSCCFRDDIELFYMHFTFWLIFSLIYLLFPGYLLAIYSYFTIYRYFTGYFGTPTLIKYHNLSFFLKIWLPFQNYKPWYDPCICFKPRLCHQGILPWLVGFWISRLLLVHLNSFFDKVSLTWPQKGSELSNFAY